jgi:hypothetical protein
MQRSLFTATVLSFCAVDFDLGRLDGRGGAGGDGQRNFAHLVQIFVVQHGRFAVIAQNGDIGAMYRAAHVQAAGQGDTHLGRQAILAWKSANSSSITALTGPEASVAGVWQWIQPWVWTMLVTPAPVPPTGT